mgnify:CR=1 FL=1
MLDLLVRQAGHCLQQPQLAPPRRSPPRSGAIVFLPPAIGRPVRREPSAPCSAPGRHRLPFPAYRLPGTDQSSGLGQGAHDFFDEKRVSARALDQQLAQRCQFRLLPNQRAEQFVGARRRQRIEPNPQVIILGRPRVRISGAIINEKQNSTPPTNSRPKCPERIASRCRSSANPRKAPAASVPGSRAATTASARRKCAPVFPGAPCR